MCWQFVNIVKQILNNKFYSGFNFEKYYRKGVKNLRGLSLN